MRNSRLFCLFLLAALVATVSAADKKQGKAVTVRKILDAEIAIKDGEPSTLTLKVTGEVPTGGYTNTRLSRAVYKQPPADGIQDYTLVSDKPSGFVTQVISQVKAKDSWPDYNNQAPWLKGFRIHGAKDGIKVIMLDPGDEQ